MKKILHLKNFGKVQKADIDLQDFVLFVGDNNSGKTYIMQLIYGIYDYMADNLGSLTRTYFDGLMNPNMNNDDLFKMIQNFNSNIKIDNNNFNVYLDFFNYILENEKHNIIQKVFNDNITIDEIHFDINLEEAIFECSINEEHDFIDLNNETNNDVDKTINLFSLEKNYGDNKSYLFKFNISTKLFIDSSSKELSRKIIYRGFNKNEGLKKFIFSQFINMIFTLIFNLSENILYLPSSRAGLHLMYKDYFISVGDASFDSSINKQNSTKEDRRLTKPVYNYLRYLQGWTLDSKSAEKNKDLLHFLEQHLINGKYEKVNQLEYIPEDTDKRIPIYLSSSMISELIPYYYYIAGSEYTSTDHLMVDEAESCLHPRKQLELVRLLIRINNDGKNILISTHSDSLASKVNNMVLISNRYNSNKLNPDAIRKLGLTEKDLFKTKNIKVYSFSDKGKYSEVNEIYFNKKTGFAFKQFEESFNMLYEEAKIIFEE